MASKVNNQTFLRSSACHSSHKIYQSKCKAIFSIAAQVSARFGEVLSGKYKKLSFLLQNVDTLNSTTKSFQDPPLSWRTNLIKLKAFYQFEVHVSSTLSWFEPGPGLTFCAQLRHVHANNKEHLRTSLWFELSKWHTYITTFINYFSCRRMLSPALLISMHLMDFPWSTPENWNPWSFLHVCKNPPSGRSSKCPSYCTHRYDPTRSNSRIFTPYDSQYKLDSQYYSGRIHTSTIPHYFLTYEYRASYLC